MTTVGEKIRTDKVKNRRNVHYSNLNELLNDAQQLAQSEVQLLGNWSLGQIYSHLGDLVCTFA
ncbi:MAG: DUF1569 domain-containing protein [Planctomycetota bacterium]